MKKTSLAASFVITVAVLPGCVRSGTGTGTNDGPSSSTRIDRRADNTCWRVTDVDCPSDATCNPPPPEQVDCTTHQPIAAEPEPRELPPVAEGPPEPPPATPPDTGRPPRPTPPENLPKAPPGADVQRRADNTCWEYFKVDCPPNAKCNPPPPRQVECE